MVENYFNKVVEVYRNLHKHCFSVRYKGHVIAHATQLYLEDVSFVVREGGRQRVLREKRKNVHAFLKGTLSKPPSEVRPQYSLEVCYNPYKHKNFQCEGSPIHFAKHVLLCFQGGHSKIFTTGV